MKLEPGVYQEWHDDKCNFDIVIVVGPYEDFDSSTYDIHGCAWCKYGCWDFGKGAFDSRQLKPHPEPDLAWAEYVKHLLIEGETNA